MKHKLEILASITALLVAIVGFLGKLTDLLGNPSPERRIWGADLVVLVILLAVTAGCLFLVKDTLRPRSRLLHADSLYIETGNPAHLKGRHDDIENLLALCQSQPLVFLVGESGVGKTALILGGLLPRLSSEEGLYRLVYLSNLGQDWARGPETALESALPDHLSDSERAMLRGAVESDSPNVSTTSFSADNSKQRLLLVFDQFDDYLRLHRSHLLKGRHWASSQRLADRNPFWGRMRKLLLTGKVHCLFVVREEAADALEVVRFVGPTVYRLDPLTTGAVMSILAELTASRGDHGEAITAPESGWEQLKRQIANDLGADGAALPIRLRLILQGLETLRELTPRAYIRNGGLAGLEAAYIIRQIRNCQKHSGLSKDEVHTLLLSFCDPRTRKAAPQTEAEIAGRTAASRQLSESVRKALLHLEQNEVLRKIVDPETHEEIWTLYHEYLTNAILASWRQANRWYALLEERHRAFREAKIWERWRTLLSIPEQLAIAFNVARGKIRLGKYRGFAALSVIRMLPILSMGLLYIILADAGLALPGGGRLRSELDRLNLSMLRPIGSYQEMQRAAAETRTALIGELLVRRTQSHWFQSDYDPVFGVDSWAHAQALAALASSPEVTEGSKIFKSFAIAFAETALVRDHHGIGYGWLRNQELNYPMAETALWMLVALARAIDRPDLFSAAERGTLVHWLHLTQEFAERYAPMDNGTWNSFPNQVDPGCFSPYATTIALVALLEIKKAGADWRGSHERLEELLRRTATWLTLHFDKTDQIAGWRGYGRSALPVAEGLTSQIYAALLRAETEADFQIPSFILQEIPIHLGRFPGRAFGSPSDKVEEYVVFRNYDGKLRKEQENIVFLWYPWTIECAQRWLARATRHQVKERGSALEERIALRTLGHLITELGPVLAKKARATYSYEVAEALYGHSSVPPPQGD